MSKRFVSVYINHRAYGGPEEGGWYYNVLEFDDVFKCKSRRASKKLLERLQKQYGYSCLIVRERRKDIGKRDEMDKPTPIYE